MMSATVWSTEFDVPQGVSTDRLTLEPLSPTWLQLDYAAIMGSRVRLRDELDWRGWPRDDFTVDENRRDLEKHYGEFERHEAYAYTVLTPAKDCCTGCIYIEPWQDGAQLFFWVTDEALATGLEQDLLETVLQWIESTWPFDRVLVPLFGESERQRQLAVGLGLMPIDAEEFPAHRCFIWHRAQTAN